MTQDITSSRPPAPALKTPYNGTLFRSRLEARWAVLFDSLRWPWAYEPLDLDYSIPDFLLRFPAGDIAVEVKPATQLADLHRHALHHVRRGWTKETLAVGAVLFDNNVIGVNAEPLAGGEHITGAARVFWCLDCGKTSLLNDDHHWRCRVTGCYAGNAHVGDMSWPPAPDLEDLWKQAGNRVQWRPGT